VARMRRMMSLSPLIKVGLLSGSEVLVHSISSKTHHMINNHPI
jgi:hypothetical protein